MSSFRNDGSHRPGSIYRIALVNFVTYKQVELLPGRNLNVIIGPNGTGKSTFVCAIVLGLCGKTSVIGRAKKLGEFVKSGCQEATIELELYRQEGQKNVIVTRTFRLDNSSTWHLDHKAVREKQVQELISGLNIQVDNLCQLLPQDRVQDFAKLNSRELLRSTLSSVGGDELVEQLNNLIESRNNQKNIGSRLSANTKQLQEEEKLNERLKSVIEAIEHRRKAEKEIEMCNIKKLWLEYQQLHDQINDLGHDKNEALKLLNKHKQRMEPTKNTVKQANDNIAKLETVKLNTVREIHIMENKLRDLRESSDTCSGQIADFLSDLREKIEQAKSREKDIHNAKVKLEKTVSDRDSLIQQNGEEADLRQEIAQLQVPIGKTNKCIEDIKSKKLHLEYELENIRPQARLLQNKLRSLEDVANKKMDMLRSVNNDTHQAVIWFRNNKHLFQAEAYEPMMLELNFTEPRFAKYLENLVNNRDLVAFTFTSAEDMNLFLKKTRSELHLKMVNAVNSPVSRTHNAPPVSLDKIRRFGFFTWLKDTITGPEAIIQFLCNNYGIHRIPIGDQDSFGNSDKVPNALPIFYTENHCFASSISTYTGEKSTRTSEIRPPRLLANTLDTEKLQQINNQLQAYQHKEGECIQGMKNFDRQTAKVEETLNELLTQRKVFSESLDKLRALTSQVRIYERKLAEIERSPLADIAAEKKACAERTKRCVLKQCRLQKELNDGVRALQKVTLDEGLWKEKIQLYRNTILTLQTELRELQRNSNAVEDTVAGIENRLTNIKTKAKEKLKEAKRKCNNKLPQDANFPYKVEFEELPADIPALNLHSARLQTAVEIMGDDDLPVAKEYDDRQKLIEKLQKEVENSSKNNRQLEEEIINIRDNWLPAVLDLVSKINEKFGEMFTRLGCSGEIKLDKDSGEEDYDQYGIGIYVCFRSSEAMSRLNPHSQSGGERALSTALYLLALQRLSVVPFRCVDEINQGMDPINERKMFQLLVDVTTNCDNAQYFLLTPKLLESLVYTPAITIHTVMNGPNLMNYKKWKFEKFLERAQAHHINSIKVE